MSKQWPTVQLGEVVTPSRTVEAPNRKSLPTDRRAALGQGRHTSANRGRLANRNTQQLFRAEAGDIIVNKIWAGMAAIASCPTAQVAALVRASSQCSRRRKPTVSILAEFTGYKDTELRAAVAMRSREARAARIESEPDAISEVRNPVAAVGGAAAGGGAD